jgi:hypothetical protein
MLGDENGLAIHRQFAKNFRRLAFEIGDQLDFHGVILKWHFSLGKKFRKVIRKRSGKMLKFYLL